MPRDRKSLPEMEVGNKTNVSERADGDNGHRSSSGPRSGYADRSVAPGLKYVLTMNGYIVL
ncbi:MAG: hypothetical protein ACLFVD_06550 [Dehalococcoidia bacterium]